MDGSHWRAFERFVELRQQVRSYLVASCLMSLHSRREIIQSWEPPCYLPAMDPIDLQSFDCHPFDLLADSDLAKQKAFVVLSPLGSLDFPGNCPFDSSPDEAIVASSCYSYLAVAVVESLVASLALDSSIK